MARRLTATIRPHDTAGRYGGEEFVVITPAADELGMMGLAERIRAAIESARVDTGGGLISVTASCGAAASAGPKPIESHALIRMADEALYRAKDGGRNRCELAKEAPILSS